MAIEFSQHRNILDRIHHMTSQLTEREVDVEIHSRIDRCWYVQKAEELQHLQTQINNAVQRLYELRLLLHTESHKAYHKLKTDHRLLKKHEQKRK